MKATCRIAFSFALLAMVSAAMAQPPLGRRGGPPRGPMGFDLPITITHIPSTAGGQQGIVVGVLPPRTPRYAQGAPVVIHVPGGVSLGSAEGPPEYAGLGFVEVRFAFPGGGHGENTSRGTYDYRGPNCVRALADVIRFATGKLADTQGRTIGQLLPDITVLTKNAGIVGSSHGGNACGLAMATHGEEFPDLAFYASMESPYGEGNVNIELGSREQGVNPAYNTKTGVLDLSKLAWSADLPPGPPRRWRNQGNELAGALFFDISGDGKYSQSDDFATNVFVQDLGQGVKAWYTPRLIREAEKRKLFGENRPKHIPTLDESTEYWRWRDAAGSIAAAVGKCPQVAVIVYANQRDHVQVAPDHPHILSQVEGFRQAGAKFVRLNADRAYVERVLASAGSESTFPDNDAGATWDRANIGKGLEPEKFPVSPYMQATVAELADRVQSQNWVKNLEAVLYPDAPWPGRERGLFGPPDESRPPRGRPPFGPGGPRPPLGMSTPDGARDDQLDRPPAMRDAPSRQGPGPRNARRPANQESTGPQTLQQTVSAEAGSKDAPLLFCIGVHVEPLGSTVSKLVSDDRSDHLRGGGRRGGAGLGPSYELTGLFERHLADIQTLAEIVQRHGGRMTVQVQTPFSRKLAETENPLLADLQKQGHEIALHFHEDAHLGSGDRLPTETWAAVMREEIDWLKKAGGQNIRFWSGGNLYPGLLEAAASAGLEVMSDYKNPRTQRDDPRLLAVHPWRPAEGPSESDLAGFARHSPSGKIVYLPNGVFDRTDHSAMRRSADMGGDYRYFDYLTRGLELSLRATRSDRVNVFHITVHPGEFRGGPEAARPFAVIDDWLGQVVAPLVKAGKIRWATLGEMADAYKAWEKEHPQTPPRVEADAAGKSAVSSGAKASRGTITFVVNTHDWGRVDKSADTLLRLIDVYSKHKVRGDFYFTAPVVEAYANSRPEVIKALRASGMTFSYHFRPPHPAYSGFDSALRDLDDAALRTTMKDYETNQLDLASGGLNRNRPGGYAYVKQTLGTAPVTVSAMGNPRAKAVLLDIYREMGAQMTMEYHESGTDPERPFAWRQGLLIRPSDFSITRCATAELPEGSFWWNQLDTPHAADFNPTAHLRRQLDNWKHARGPLITVLIHENDFYVHGGPSWSAIYMGSGGKRPQRPPYDLNATDRAQSRSADNQAAIWRVYEELVAYAAKNLTVATSADIVKMAQSSDTR